MFTVDMDRLYTAYYSTDHIHRTACELLDTVSDRVHLLYVLFLIRYENRSNDFTFDKAKPFFSNTRGPRDRLFIHGPFKRSVSFSFPWVCHCFLFLKKGNHRVAAGLLVTYFWK